MAQKFNDFSRLNIIGDFTDIFEQRIENDGSGNPLYLAYNKIANAPTSATTWFIKKLTYTGGYVTRIQLPDDGADFNYSWDARATYFS